MLVSFDRSLGQSTLDKRHFAPAQSSLGDLYQAIVFCNPVSKSTLGAPGFSHEFGRINRIPKIMTWSIGTNVINSNNSLGSDPKCSATP